MGKKKTLRDHASTLSDTLAPHVENARDKAGPALADARDRAVPAIAGAAAGAAAKAGPALTEVKARAVPVLVDAKDRAVPYLVDARDKAAPVLYQARDKAAPVVASALDRTAPVRDKAGPVLSDARDRFTTEVLPVVTSALAALDSATEDARAETKKRGRALARSLKAEVVPPPKKTHRLRNLLVVLGLGGVAFALSKRFGSKQTTTDWQSSYTPPAGTGPVGDVGIHRATTDAGTDATTGATTDAAASDPGEVAADAQVAPHEATTPDHPVTEVDVDPVDKP
jgi:hypothetical protein